MTEAQTNAGTESVQHTSPPESVQHTSPPESVQHTSLPESSQLKTCRDFQECYSLVQKQIEFGHQAEIQGDTRTAILSYSEVLRMIQQIMLQSSELSGCTSAELSQVKDTQRKLSLVKLDVSGRLKTLQSGASHSKDEPAQGNVSSKSSVESKSDLYLDFDVLSSDSVTKATEVFTIPNGALMFYISADGTLTESSKRQTLHVVTFDHGFKKLSNGAFIPPAFLQVGDWLYPLMPGLTPAMITKYRTYIFPDVLSDDRGSAVAIVLSLSVPKIERMKFEVILDHFTVLDNKHIQKEYLQALSDMDIVLEDDSQSTFNIASIISFTITVAASLTAWIITTGAFLIIWFVQLAFRMIRSQITPTEEPSIVDPNIRQGVTYVKTATTATVKVKQYVVDKLGESTMQLALHVAPILKDQGEKVLPSFLLSPGSEFVKGTSQITSSTIRGTMPSIIGKFQAIVLLHMTKVFQFLRHDIVLKQHKGVYILFHLSGMTTVYKSLDFASMSVMDNITRESFNTIQYRFGDDVGSFASETLSTARYMVKTARSAQNMNLMRFAVRAGKPKGRAALHDHVKNLKGSTNAKTIITPVVFVKANAILHDSAQTYVKILERLGRSKMDLRRRSLGSSGEESIIFRRGTVDGVLKAKTGKPRSYYQVQPKNKLQGRRYTMPANLAHLDSDLRNLLSDRSRSSQNLTATVLSTNEFAPNANNPMEHIKNIYEKRKMQLAKEEQTAAKVRYSEDIQSKITRRRGSVYKS